MAVEIRRLNIDEAGGDAYLLGYPMRLTPTELRILREIMCAESIDAEELAHLCGLAERTRGNLSVHICAINRKAEIIGKRKLILFHGHKYWLNEFM